MVMAVKERCVPQGQSDQMFICLCFDQPNRRIVIRMSGGVGGRSAMDVPIPICFREVIMERPTISNMVYTPDKYTDEEIHSS